MNNKYYKLKKYYIEPINEIYKNNNFKNANKINGNIFAYAIRKMIQDILKNSEYYVSYNNAFINNSPIEWDLLIIKNENPHQNIINVYDYKNIICAIEIKSGGYMTNLKVSDYDEKTYHFNESGCCGSPCHRRDARCLLVQERVSSFGQCSRHRGACHGGEDGRPG